MTTKKYSLRKVKVGVASVLVGFGIATTGAAVANAADEVKPDKKLVEVKPVNLEDVKKEAAANLEATYKKTLENLEATYKKALESREPQLSHEEIAKVKKEKEKVIAKLKEEVENTKLALSEGIDAGLSAEDVLAELDVKPNKADKDGKYPAPKGEELKRDKDGNIVDSVAVNGGIPEDVKAIINKELEKEAELKALTPTPKEAEYLTQWVSENGDVLLEEEKENADQNFLGHHDGILNDGFVFVKKEVDGNITKYIYKDPTIKYETQWVDEDGEILFVAEGVKEQNYDNYHSILEEHGYILLGSDTIGTDEKTTVTGYVYKKGPNYKKITSYVPTTAPVVEELPEFTGGVNGAEPAVLEKPEFKVEKTNEGRFVVEEGKAKTDEAKAETKEGSLPNTGMTTSSTAALGLGLIALVALAVRRKLNN